MKTRNDLRKDTPRRYTYKDAGVDVHLGDICSKIAYNACKKTFKNLDERISEALELEGGFSGPVRIKDLTNALIVKNSDGVGSKVLIAQLLNKHSTVGQDLIAMNVDDTVSIGAQPIIATNTLDVKTMNADLVNELMKGLVKACEVAKIAMVGGEIAELSEQVTGYGQAPYIWNADILGVLEKEKLIDGSKIAPGNVIIAVKSNGIRSNGLTLARRICRDNFGVKWYEEPFKDTCWGEVLLKPSRICASAILDLVGRYKEEPKAEVTGLVHITGGGLQNLRRVLKGLGADIYGLFDPHPEFLKLQELGSVSDMEAYSTWNMGQCFFIITPEPEADTVMGIMKEHDIETKIAGEVTAQKIRVESRGFYSEDFIVD